MVPGVGLQAELALEQAGPPGGVDDPARLGLPLASELLERHLVRVALEVHLAHARALRDVDAELPRTSRERVLEQSPVELVVVVRRPLARAHLEALGDVLVAVGGQPVAQAALDQLLLLQVVVHAHVLREVLRPGRDGGLADLERRQRSRSTRLS